MLKSRASWTVCKGSFAKHMLPLHVVAFCFINTPTFPPQASVESQQVFHHLYTFKFTASQPAVSENN